MATGDFEELNPQATAFGVMFAKPAFKQFGRRKAKYRFSIGGIYCG